MRLLWTPKWLLVHAAVVVMVVAFFALCYWQVTRAAGGNALSFGYAIEWPAFAAFTVWVWVKEMRRAVTQATSAPAAEPPSVAERQPRVRTGAAYDDSGDEQLAAYNRYLSWLNAHPNTPTSEYPG